MRWVAILSERAKWELKDSREWYEEKQVGLGDRFVNEVVTKLRNLEQDPTKGLRRNQHYYEAIVKTFPFLIIYRIERDSKSYLYNLFFIPVVTLKRNIIANIKH